MRLVPHWVDDPKIGQRMINARGETAATKPVFRATVKYRHYLVPLTTCGSRLGFPLGLTISHRT